MDKHQEIEKIKLPGIKHIIVVASGKGGVGKSTVAAGLALSIGFIIHSHQARLWRGPVASNGLKQLINETQWGELDYLIIDTPPGTGDIHLTLLQQYEINGAVIVTTPQKIAQDDVQKAITMFRNEHVKIPVLGIVENLAWFTPSAHPGCRRCVSENTQGRAWQRYLRDARQTTCTGIAYHSGIIPFETTMTAVARQFALMNQAGYENFVCSCVTSFGIYTEILETWKHFPRKKKRHAKL